MKQGFAAGVRRRPLEIVGEPEIPRMPRSVCSSENPPVPLIAGRADSFSGPRTDPKPSTEGPMPYFRCAVPDVRHTAPAPPDYCSTPDIRHPRPDARNPTPVASRHRALAGRPDSVGNDSCLAGKPIPSTGPQHGIAYTTASRSGRQQQLSRRNPMPDTSLRHGIAHTTASRIRAATTAVPPKNRCPTPVCGTASRTRRQAGFGRAAKRTGDPLPRPVRRPCRNTIDTP